MVLPGEDVRENLRLTPDESGARLLTLAKDRRAAQNVTAVVIQIA